MKYENYWIYIQLRCSISMVFSFWTSETNAPDGIRVVGKGSWKEREVGKLRWSWKEPSEVRKNRAKLGRTDWSWKDSTEVGKFFFKLESFAEVGKFRCSWKVLAEVGKLSLKLESVTALNNGTKGWTWTVWKCQTGRSKSIKVGGSRKSKPKCTITLISP